MFIVYEIQKVCKILFIVELFSNPYKVPPFSDLIFGILIHSDAS